MAELYTEYQIRVRHSLYNQKTSTSWLMCASLREQNQLQDVDIFSAWSNIQIIFAKNEKRVKMDFMFSFNEFHCR